MAKRKPSKKIYTYECSLTEEKFKLTRAIDHKDDLMSVAAYYELNPEQDDRPKVIKQQLSDHKE